MTTIRKRIDERLQDVADRSGPELLKGMGGLDDINEIG